MDEALEKKVVEYAMEGHTRGLNCAESIIDALIRAGVPGIPREALAMATGFGGGIGMCGHTCGALSAAVMAVGAKHGRLDPYATPEDARRQELGDKYYRIFNRMTHEFRERHGNVLCGAFTGQAGGWASPARRKTCAGLVKDTAAMACRYLAMNREEAEALKFGPNLAGRE